MINIVSRSGNLAPYLKSTTQVVASQVKPLAAPAIVPPEKVKTPALPETHTSYALSQTLPKGNLRICCGPTVHTQIRFAHTDIQVPDFTPYRRVSVTDPTKRNTETAEERKSFTYVIVGTGAVGGAYVAKSIVHEFLQVMSASADVLALAKIEINLGDIPEGKSVTFKWRGKPLFIRHRTADEIQTEQSVNISTLRDPEPDSNRVQKPEWLVVIGVCTHLGCVPIANAGDFNGYYCPCHGSHYDASGRARKGPAPLNLEVPQYSFLDETTIVVG